MNDSLYLNYKKDIVDNIYGDQYHHLFPDIDNPEIPPYLEDIGDDLISTDDFVKIVLDLYTSSVGLQTLSDNPYEPPKAADMADDIYIEYENLLQDKVVEIYERELSVRGVKLSNDESNELYDLINEEIYEEYVNEIGVTVEERIMRVLDFYKLSYIGEDFIKNENKNGYISYEKIFNSSQIPLFEMTYNNTWDEGGCYDDSKNIERGYCNLLRTSMGVL